MGSCIPKLHNLRVNHMKSVIVELLVLSLVPVQLGLSHMDIENMNIELALKINIISIFCFHLDGFHFRRSKIK